MSVSVNRSNTLKEAGDTTHDDLTEETWPNKDKDSQGYYRKFVHERPDGTSIEVDGIAKFVAINDSPTDALFRLHHNICDRAKSIMRAKNADYTAQSTDPFANFRGSTYLGIDPVLGILLRMQDKLMRLRSFAEHGELKVVDEGIEDTTVDILNYAILALAMLKERKQ